MIHANVLQFARPLGGPQMNTDKWQRRYANYQRLRTLLDAEEEFGPFKRAEEENERALDILRDRHGRSPQSRWPQDAEAERRRLLDESNARSFAFYHAFYERAERAAMLLVLTPAPDLAAMKIKVDLVKLYELDNDTRFPGEPIDYIRRDAKSLALVPQANARIDANHPATCEPELREKRRSSDEWDAFLATYEASKAALDDATGRASECDVEDRASEFVVAREALFGCAAPNFTALNWKLDYLRETAEHSIVTAADLARIQRDIVALI